MERNERDNRRHHDSDNRSNRHDGFQNYRDRYSNRHGNYYGMHDEHAEYRDVRSSNPDPNFGYRSGGPVGGYGASSHRGVTERSEHYRYGDPNPYMGDRRNQRGGYDRDSGINWEERDVYGTYGNPRSTNYSAGSNYSRQDNSYQYGGQGRRYEDFNTDEKMYRGRGDHGYNMLGIDAYYDRGEHPERRSDNDFRGSDYQRDYYNRHHSGDDERYRGEIHSSNRSDNYDYSQRSSRYRRPGETSGPDYGAHSGPSAYGDKTTRA